LATIPNELEEYFKKMLNDIDERFRQQTAHAFLITLNGAEKLPLMCYWFIQEDNRDMVSNSRQQSLPKETATMRLTDMAQQLNARSKGLLKANNMQQESFLQLEEYQWLFEFRVDFLHRTVADFLRTPDMQALLTKWSAKSFDVDLEICKSCLETIKITPSEQIMFKESSRALSVLHLFFSHTKLLEESPTFEESNITLVDELVCSLKVHNDILEDIKLMILGPGNYWAYNCSFNFAILYHCISYGLGIYVGHQLDRGQLEFEESPSGLLSGCLSRDPRVRTGQQA